MIILPPQLPPEPLPPIIQTCDYQVRIGYDYKCMTSNEYDLYKKEKEVHIPVFIYILLGLISCGGLIFMVVGQ